MKPRFLNRSGMSLLQVIAGIAISAVLMAASSKVLLTMMRGNEYLNYKNSLEDVRNQLRLSGNCRRTVEAFGGTDGICAASGTPINVLDKLGRVIIANDESTKVGRVRLRAFCDANNSYVIQRRIDAGENAASPRAIAKFGEDTDWANLFDMPVACAALEYYHCQVTAAPNPTTVGDPFSFSIHVDSNVDSSRLEAAIAEIGGSRGALDAGYNRQVAHNFDRGTYNYNAEIYRVGQATPVARCTTPTVTVNARQCDRTSVASSISDLFNPVVVGPGVFAEVQGNANYRIAGDDILAIESTQISGADNNVAITRDGAAWFSLAEPTTNPAGVKDSTTRTIFGATNISGPFSFNLGGRVIISHSPGPAYVRVGFRARWEISLYSTHVANLAHNGDVCILERTSFSSPACPATTTASAVTGNLHFNLGDGAPGNAVLNGSMTYTCANGAPSSSLNVTGTGAAGFFGAHPLHPAITMSSLAIPFSVTGCSLPNVFTITGLACTPEVDGRSCTYNINHVCHGLGSGNFRLYYPPNTPPCTCN